MDLMCIFMSRVENFVLTNSESCWRLNMGNSIVNWMYRWWLGNWMCNCTFSVISLILGLLVLLGKGFINCKISPCIKILEWLKEIERRMRILTLCGCGIVGLMIVDVGEVQWKFMWTLKWVAFSPHFGLSPFWWCNMEWNWCVGHWWLISSY